MQHWIRAARSYVTSLRASARLGRANKLERGGNIEAAASVAREGLTLLRAPHVLRMHPSEGAALTTLTMLVEAAAESRGIAGADPRDVRDSIEFLKQLPDGSAEVREMLPFLETRLRGSAA